MGDEGGGGGRAAERDVAETAREREGGLCVREMGGGGGGTEKE